MEMDSCFEKVVKWYVPENSNQEKAFKLLASSVKNIFLDTKAGVHFFLLPNFLDDVGVNDESVGQAGFEQLSHFLFHCDEFLEVRGKKSNGKIHYFLFIQEKIRKEKTEVTSSYLSASAGGGKYILPEDEVYHQTTFPSAFSKVLNLYREILIETENDGRTNFSVKVKGKDEKVGRGHENGHDVFKVPSANPVVCIREVVSLTRRNDAPDPRRESDAESMEPVTQIKRSHVFETPDSLHYRHRVVFY